MNIPHSKPFVDEEDALLVYEQIKTGMHATGKKTEEFENAICKLVGKKYARAVNSGANALFISLKALDIGKGDEVIIPSYVCQSLLHAIKRCNASVVFCDIQDDFLEKGFNISAQKVKEKMSKKTKAIIVPHMFGIPAEIDKIIDLGIPVIEDCCQGIGIKHNGKMCGNFGKISMFSFYATKIISTGHGGMILCDDLKLKEKIDDLLKYDQREEYDVAYNYGFTDIQAALGLKQLERLNWFIERRKDIGKKYDSAFDGKFNFMKISEGGFPFRYIIKLGSKEKRDLMIEKLRDKGIRAEIPIWKPLHRYLDMNDSDFPNSAEAFEKTISIPIYPALKDEEVEYVITTLMNEI